MTTINKNETVKKKNKEAVCGINSTIKRIIREDDLDTLLSMIQNGFDINTFSYKNSKGINAFILYKYDNNKENVGKVIDTLLIKFDAIKDVTEETYDLLNKLSYNDFKKSISKEFSLEDLLEGFGEFLKELSENVLEDDDIKEDDSIGKDNNQVSDTQEDSKVSPKNNQVEDVHADIISNKKSENEDMPTTETFDIIGDTNYKVSSISAYITLENEDTCDTKQISMQASSIEELSSLINKEIEKANNENNEKLASSVVEMMSNNPEFKKSLLSLMREAQISRPC